MNAIVTAIPLALQTLFGIHAPRLARLTHFVLRQGVLDPAEFARTFSLYLIRYPKASLEQLGRQLSISASALCQRLQNRKAARFLRAMLFRSLAQLSHAQLPTKIIPLLKRFNGVYLCDCTSISLPRSLIRRFRGCGGGTKSNDINAAVKILLRTNMSTGKGTKIRIGSARNPDIKLLNKLPSLPKGALHIADLGFFDTDYFNAQNEQGVYWLTRLPAMISVCQDQEWEDVAAWLKRLGRKGITRWEGQLRVGKTTPMSARVMVQQCSPKEVARRRRKLHERMGKKGKTPGWRQLALCGWWVLATNVATEKLSHAEATELYRGRWQVELVFKRWKSLGHLGVEANLSANRAECELYGRLLGVILVDWLALLRGGPLSGVSMWHVWQVILDLLDLIGRAIRGAIDWNLVLNELVDKLQRIPKQPKRKTHPSTRQRLLNPEVTALA